MANPCARTFAYPAGTPKKGDSVKITIDPPVVFPCQHKITLKGAELSHDSSSEFTIKLKDNAAVVEVEITCNAVVGDGGLGAKVCDMTYLLGFGTSDESCFRRCFDKHSDVQALSGATGLIGAIVGGIGGFILAGPAGAIGGAVGGGAIGLGLPTGVLVAICKIKCLLSSS